MSSHKTVIEFDDTITRMFMIAAIGWALVGMSAGVFIAWQLAFWKLNFGLEWTTFGRLRPLHTNAAIFAFVGNMMFAGIYYSTQRLVKARLPSHFLSRFHFWGWQAIIVAAAITLPLGLTRGKEYAELIWPINLAVVAMWVVFAANFFWLLARRNERSLYVAVWFYIATIVTVAMLYIVNHLQVPTGWLHGYPIFGGVQDALVQWWYGHNAVAFFLTTPILGIMYYYLPKAADRPVYSYRLSIIHFWSLVFIYIWAGPHHLLYTALPDWLQSLGMLFSLMLWAPSWGGMLNGLLTLRGAWDKLRADPVLKFFAAGVTFYGMATFEGPLMAIKAVNSLSHYTDWTIGHVHSGTLGWNGFMAAGMFYWLAPRLWNTRLWSTAMANMHFWLGLVGILLYIAAMWISGITQGLMLNATKEAGNVLTWPNFIDTILAIRPMMHMRATGGMLYLAGFFMMAFNIWKTARSGSPVNGTVEIEPAHAHAPGALTLREAFLNAPVLYSALLILFACVWGLRFNALSIVGLGGIMVTVVAAMVHIEMKGQTWGLWYERLSASALPFTLLAVIAVAVGGMVQIIPTVVINKSANIRGLRQVPWTPLELAGRDLFIREGCYNCHSQMVRPFIGEVLRYGNYSRLGESIDDHPFQWGSKRTGPDLHRVGGKYPNAWHWKHMRDPRSTSVGSNMPPYPWLYRHELKLEALPRKMAVLRMLSVPFPPMTKEETRTSAREQAAAIAADLVKANENAKPDREIIALIAYLQKLGRSEPVPEPAPSAD